MEIKDRLELAEKQLKQITLETELKRQGAINPAITSRAIIDNVAIDDNGDMIFTDKWGGDTSVENGVAEFLHDNPQYLAKNIKAPAPDKPNYGTMSPAKFRELWRQGKI